MRRVFLDLTATTSLDPRVFATSSSMQPSHVLLAMGRDPKTEKSALRFAFRKSNTVEDMEFAVEALSTVLMKMKG